MGFSNVQGIPGLRAVAREGRSLDGRAAAAAVGARIAQEIADRDRSGKPAPALAAIAAGETAATEACLAALERRCGECGVSFAPHRFGAGATEAELGSRIDALNDDPEVSGILLLLPLPAGIAVRPLLERIDPRKDVDGLNLSNATRFAQGMRAPVPATARGVLALLDHHEIELAGRRAVVVGRSELVGRPVATLLNQRDSTVTVCHSQSRDLEGECRRAEVLIVAAGQPHLIGAGHVRHGAAVIDIGVHRRDGRLTGDVDYDAVRPRAGAISPVPGGVGPMMVASLLENTLAAAAADPAFTGSTQAPRPV